jgi:AcrR family transcriptional regulator
MNQDSPSASRLQPVTARGQRSRLRLLRAAEYVFGQKGFERASIAEICRRAGSALGSFYTYFPDKKAAYVELVDSLGSRLRSELATAVEGIEGRLDIERAGLRAFFDFAARHRQLYRIVRQAEFVDPPSFYRYYRKLAAAYTTGLARAMEEGELRTLDPEIAAYALMGMADFLGMRWVLWETGDLDHVVDSAMDFLTSGMAPTKVARTSTKRASKRLTKASVRAHR